MRSRGFRPASLGSRRLFFDLIGSRVGLVGGRVGLVFGALGGALTARRVVRALGGLVVAAARYREGREEQSTHDERISHEPFESTLRAKVTCSGPCAKPRRGRRGPAS